MSHIAKTSTIQSHLMGILGLTLLIGAFITISTMIVFNQLQQDAKDFAQRANALNHAWALQNLTLRMERSQLSYLLIRDPRYIRDNERYRQNLAQLLNQRNDVVKQFGLENLYNELEREVWAYQSVFFQIQQAGEKNDWTLAQEYAQGQDIHLANLKRGNRLVAEKLQPIVDTQLEQAIWQVRVIGLVGLTVFLGFTALVIAAANLVDRRLTRPMRRLTRTMQEIPNNNFVPSELTPLIGFADQLGDLTWSLVQIVERHQERKARLAQQIHDLREQIKQMEKL